MSREKREMSNIGIHTNRIGNVGLSLRSESGSRLGFGWGLGLVAVCMLVLTGCSGYSSQFHCPEGRGLSCEMIRNVDKKIDSGEIDKVYKKECRNGSCKDGENEEELVLPKLSPIKAKAKSKFMWEKEVMIRED